MKSIKAAFVCGIAPLVLGTVIFFTWRIGGVLRWERAWLWAIGFGVVCLVAGTVFLLRHIRLQQSSWRAPALAAAILFLNVPVAVIYMKVAIDVLTRYTVEVRNDSTDCIDSFILRGPGIASLELGPIVPGSRVLRHLRFTSDGKLRFEARYGKLREEGILEGSANPISNGSKLCRLAPDGTWEIRARE